MIRYLTSALCCLGLAAGGCKSEKTQPEPRAAATDLVTEGSDGDRGMIVQPRLSGGDEAPSDEGRIRFTITKVEPGQKPASAPPFHEPGGDWTYVEAHLDGDPAASFVVGIPTLSSTGGGPSFGKLMFAPTTSAAGARVVARLAKVLGTTVPPPRPGGVLQAVKVPIAVLGHGIRHLDNGMGETGTWDATKLFCSVGDIDSAELFFNISIEEKRGELSEKDADYNKDVVACLATILRDGLPPPRTPANDPTLATTGPRLELGKKLGGRRMQGLALTPSRLLMADERAAHAALVAVDVKSGATNELWTTKDRIDGGDCDPALAHCVLELSTPQSGRNVYGNDPSHLAWLEGTTVTPISVGRIAKPKLATAALSPDARFIVAHDDAAKPPKLVALDRTTKKTFELPGIDRGSIDVVAWDGTTAIVVTSTYDEGATPRVVEWQLGANGATKRSTRPAEPPLVSPDGKRLATFAAGKLTLTAGTATRTLVFHPDDARSIGSECCTWIDNRWLTMRSGYIDTDAMRVSLLAVDADGELPRVEYLTDSRSALVTRADGVFLATVVGP